MSIWINCLRYLPVSACFSWQKGVLVRTGPVPTVPYLLVGTSMFSWIQHLHLLEIQIHRRIYRAYLYLSLNLLASSHWRMIDCLLSVRLKSRIWLVVSVQVPVPNLIAVSVVQGRGPVLQHPRPRHDSWTAPISRHSSWRWTGKYF